MINKDYISKSGKPRIPVHERPIPTTDFDDLIGKQRKIRPKMAEDEEDDWSFKPELTSKNNIGRRSVDDLLSWGIDKRFKLANQRLAKLQGNECSFKPVIDEKSKKMAGKRKGRVHNRLLKAGKNLNEKLEGLKASQEKGMFRPQINLNSKKMLLNKNENLYKKDNGDTWNLDFWEALPVSSRNFNEMGLSPKKKKKKNKEGEGQEGSSKGLLKMRRTGSKGSLGGRSKSRKNLGKSRSKSARKLGASGAGKGRFGKSRSTSKFNRTGGDKGRSKSKTGKKGKKKGNSTDEFLDEYVSPYNKMMLASGLPLKTIINKSKAIHQKKKKGTKRDDKGRSKSRKGRNSRNNPKGSKSRSKSGRTGKIRRSKSVSWSWNQLPSFMRDQELGAYKRLREDDSGHGAHGSGLHGHGHSGSTREIPYCQRFKGKESARSRRQRLFNHRSWTQKINQRNRSKNQNKMKKLIYRDLYDAKTGPKRKNSASIDAYFLSAEKAILNSRKQRKKRPAGGYHPRNESNEKRRKLGNKYMYQSIDENMPVPPSHGYGVTNVFQSVNLH